MKMSERTRPYTEKPKIPWKQLGLLLFWLWFITIPFQIGWLLRYSDSIDGTKIDLEIFGWILVGSVIIVIFRRLIWKGIKFLKSKGEDLPNYQD